MKISQRRDTIVSHDYRFFLFPNDSPSSQRLNYQKILTPRHALSKIFFILLFSQPFRTFIPIFLSRYSLPLRNYIAAASLLSYTFAFFASRHGIPFEKFRGSRNGTNVRSRPRSLLTRKRNDKK